MTRSERSMEEINGKRYSYNMVAVCDSYETTAARFPERNVDHATRTQ